MVTNSPGNIPTGASGTVLRGGGVGTASAFSTATYPSTATGTGTLLRADGTNWVATTSTYPNTNAVSTLLYASSANVMSALATANSGVLTTDSSGVPSIDTTNFVRQTTGMQMKGNNANTAPPSGFIGEQIRSFLAGGTPVALVSNTAANVTSINLTAGIWDISGLVTFSTTGGVTNAIMSVNNTSATLGNDGDNWAWAPIPIVGTASTGCIPSWRLLTTGASTTVYLVAFSVFAVAMNVNGRISATRVG